MIKLTSTTSNSVINALKAMSSRHGIPQTLVGNNGPQYFSGKFAKFASSYRFLHVTSSPYFSQSNSCADRAVQTMKNLLKHSDDFYLTMLMYRTTPLSGFLSGFSTGDGWMGGGGGGGWGLLNQHS